MNRFKSLLVWQKSMHLASVVYKLTDKLPEHEKFGLKHQIRKSVVSIPSNIAEGAGRNSFKEFRYFLSIAQGSAFELETQLLICCRLNYLTNEDIKEATELIEEINNMLFGLQRNLKKQISKA